MMNVFLFSSSQIRCNGQSAQFGGLQAGVVHEYELMLFVWWFFFKTMIFKKIYIEKILTKHHPNSSPF